MDTNIGVQNADVTSDATAPVDTNNETITSSVEDQGNVQTPEVNPVVDQLQKSKTEDNRVPYSRFEEVNKAKQQLEAELNQLRNTQTQPVKQQQSSSNNFQIDPDLAPLYEGLPPVEFDNELVYDEQGNQISGEGFRTKTEMYMAFEQKMLKRLGLIDQNMGTKQQKAQEESQKSIALDIQSVKEQVNDDAVYSEFADWAAKKLDNPKNKLSIPELYELWKEDIYKPKRTYQKQNAETTATKIATPNGTQSSGSTSVEELRQTGLRAAFKF